MTYADDFNLRNKSVVKMNDVANAVDGLLATYGSASSTSSVSLTSGTYTDYTGLSVAVSMNDGEMAIVTAVISASVATANDQISIRITANGTAQATEQAACPNLSSTAGNNVIMVCTTINVPSAGTNTYKLQWLNSTSGARTIYSVRGRLDVLVVQNT